MSIKNKEQEELKDPTFIDQANAIIDESYAVKIEDPDYIHGLKPRDHKLLVKVLDLHEKYVDDKIIAKFVDQISKYYEPIVASLKKIDKLAIELPEIKKQLNNIELRQSNEDRRLNEHDIDIELNRQVVAATKAKLELIEKVTKPDIIKEFLDKIEMVTPKLDKIIEINQPRTIRKRIIKAVTISVLICIFILNLAFYIHNRNSNKANKTIPQTEQPKDSTTVNPQTE